MKTNPSRFIPRYLAALCAVAWSLALLLMPAVGRAALLPNRLVNNPAHDLTTRDSQQETAIALGSGNAVFSAYVDTGSWDGTPGGVNNHLIGLSLSLDGGVNWTDQGELPIPTVLGDGMNPALAHGLGVGALGDSVYLATTLFDPTGAGSSGLQIYRFQDDGFPFIPNFQGMVTVAAGLPGEVIERPSIAVDNFPGVALGQGMVYLAWRKLLPGGGSEILFASSGFGGDSFDPPVVLASVAAPANRNAPVVVVGADHAVYVFYLSQETVGVTPNVIRVRKSINAGMTFAASVDVVTMNAANTARDGDLKLQSGFSGNSFPHPGANPSFASVLHVAYNDKGTAVGDKSDVFLMQSGTGGATWTGPFKVNDDTGGNDQFSPTFAYAPDGQTSLIGYYDRRRDTNNILIDTYGTLLTIGFRPSFRITTESFPPVTDQDPGYLNPVQRDSYMGSYDGMVADNSGFYYTWGDNRLAHSSVGHKNQPDVRFTKIPVGGPGGMLDLFHERLVAAVNVGPVAISGGNGDSVIDRNEYNLLDITLINRGNSNIVGIAASLQSLTPGVLVSPGAQFYPDIGPGASGAGVSPFSMITPADFVCGSIIHLQLTVTTFAEGTFVIPFDLNTGQPGPVTSFVSADPPIPIPDGDGYRPSTINVSGLSGPISSVAVRLHITHPRQGDLDISLEGPDGTTIVLSSDNGTMANYGASCPPVPNRAQFSDNGAPEITQAPAGDFTGAFFQPEQRLAAFISKSGSAANGVWKLQVRDDTTGVTGTIECWQLDITTATCVDGGVGTGFLSAARTHVSGGNGNARLDPNECADLTIVLTNLRPVVAYTAVSAVLTSQTPGVTVVQPNSAYPNIPSLQARANLTPFKVSVSPSIPCGSIVKLSLRVSAFNELPFDVPVQLQVGTCAATTYAAVLPQVPLLIPDGPAGIVDSIIPVSGMVAPIGKVTVSVGIQHPHVSDLKLTLIAPGGTAVILAQSADGGGDNFGTFSGPFTCLVPTTFDDAAGATLAESVPPYADTFMPQQSLFAFSGLSGAAVNGNWRLRIEDQVGIEVGLLVCWSLSVCEAEQFTPVLGTMPARVDDLSFNDIAIPVSGITGPLNKVRVAMRIRHTFVSDLEISLIAPDGTTVDLSSGNGGASVNYGLNCASPTVFDDDATTVITALLPATPFANGTFRPEEPLSAFAGKSGAQVNGIWTLHVADVVGGDFGQVDCLLLDLFTADCTDGGGTCAPNRTLTVGSLNSGTGVPITVSLADINMDQNGTTTFTRTYGNGVSVVLTAPAVAPNGNTFVKWKIGVVDQPLGVLATTVALNGDRTATAVYAGPSTLTVASSPGPGVTILVSPADNGALTDGVTLFTRHYNPLTTVTLKAPAMSPAGGTFVRWRINGVDQTLGLDTVLVPMDVNRTATAVYVGPAVLTVQSQLPGSGVNITVGTADIGGATDGLTTFTRRYPIPGATPVVLTAPPTAPNGYLFLRWNVDGNPRPLGQAAITVTMNIDHTAVAIYDRPTRLLTVESDDPDSGVLIAPVTADIHGAGPGVTTFVREYNKATLVSLTAPDVLGSGRLFKRWEIDGDDQPKGQHTIFLSMDDDRKVEAEYMSATVELEVKSEDPDHGVPITVFTADIHGLSSGVTTFEREYNRDRPGSPSFVTLLAPPQANGRLFKRWEVDGDDQPNGQRLITVQMDDDIDVEAEYDDDVTGGTSYALWFDGFNDRVQIPDNATVRITGLITIEAWINRDITGMEMSIVDKSGCPGDALQVGGYGLSVTSGDKLRFQTKDNCAVVNTVIGTTSLQAGVWYHVAGVWDGGQLLVYVNGALDGIVANPNGPKTGNTPLFIGARGNGLTLSPFAGQIDEVRLWKKARTQIEIATGQGACLTGAEPLLVGYWRFNEHDTMVAHDSTANLNNGMLVNAPLWVDSAVACASPSPSPLISPLPAPFVPAAASVIVMSRDVSGQVCHLTVKGPPGSEALVEVSGDMIHWAPLECITNVTGSFKLSDPMNTSANKRFFRVRDE